MAKKKEFKVVDTQKDGDIVIETVVEKEMVPVFDDRGINILYWVEK